MSRKLPGKHGLCAREQEIMDLFDAGIGESEICAGLGLKPDFVSRTVQTYRFDAVWSASARFNTMTRAGSQALAAATARVGRFA